MDNLDKLTYTDTVNEPSCFYRGKFTVDKALDTFLYLDSFKKGFVLINGFNIGRYWEIGPQRSLYIPASLLREGENEIIVFESDGLKGEPVIEFKDFPTLQQWIAVSGFATAKFAQQNLAIYKSAVSGQQRTSITVRHKKAPKKIGAFFIFL